MKVDLKSVLLGLLLGAAIMFAGEPRYPSNINGRALILAD